MRKLIYITVFVGLFMLVPLRAVGEEIYTISENSYETEEFNLKIAPDEFAGATDFVFRSSPALRGRIEILSTEDDSVEIYFHKVLFAESEEQARSFAELIDVKYEFSSNTFIVSAEAERNAPWRKTADLAGKVECEIYLPKEFSISMSLVGYYINIKGPFPEAEISGEYCDEIRVSRIDLGLKVDANNSTVILRDINGPTLIEGERAGITARNVDSGLGIASFENKQGSIALVGFTGDELHCVGEEGKITLEKLTLANGARVYVSNSGINSDIYVDVEEINDSRLEIFNKEADITMLLPIQVEAEFEVSTDPDNGEIDFNGISLITEDVGWGQLKARTSNSNSRILLDARGAGKIDVRRKDF